MTQRSQNNPRNQARQKHGEGIKGVSRKSASSAKPKRAAASSVYTSKAKKKGRLEKSLDEDSKKQQRAKERRRETAMGAKLTEMPEYKRWRRIWWIIIVIAVVACIFSFLIGQFRASGAIDEQVADVLAPVLLVIGYGGIIAALFIDLGKIRKMRKNLEAQTHSMSKAQLRKLDAAIEEDDKRYEEARQQRKSRRPWGKKKAAEGAQDNEGKE